MRFTHDQLCQLERTMTSASNGIRMMGVTKQTADDLRTLEYVMSVVRQAGRTLSNPDAPPEDIEAAMACFYDGLFR